MNKKGFTVVELIVTFTLTMTIAIFLFQIIMVLKDLYISYGTKTELLNKQSLISYQINESLNNKKIKSITKCGSYCLNFIYDDDTKEELIVNKDNLSFQFGNYKVTLPEGTTFGNMDINVYISPIFDSYKNDSILTINIPIYNSLLKNQNFGINSVYQYNSLTSNISSVVFDENESEYGALLLKGNKELNIYNDESYTDAGYTLLDKDGNVINNPNLVTVNNPFDSMSIPYEIGKYDIKYYYKDTAGNTLDIKTRTVTVREHIKLELVGNSETYIAQNGSYVDAGYNVVDGNGNIVNISNYPGYLVNTTGNVDTSNIGTYTIVNTLTYNGKEISIAMRTINVINGTYNFNYTGDYQTFIVPSSGNYKIELWGASGGSVTYSNTVYRGGFGGYALGNITLSKGNNLYIYVGGHGQSVTGNLQTVMGGYNGGGNGLTYSLSDNTTASGGGATDIRLDSSLNSRIIVASGGGAAHWTNSVNNAYGGHGGGLTGLSSTEALKCENPLASGGTQISGGTGYSIGLFGLGANYNAGSTGAGGGGGYYGGGSANGGGGGSSFISGYTGCDAVDSNGNHTGQPNHYSGHIFTNTQMIAGDSSMPNPVGGTETGHTGNGYARITFISQ